MRRLSARALLSLILAGTVTSMTASSPAIGLATANGSFQVDSARVWGNTTLLDGSVVETAKAPSQLKLNNGAELRLASDSRARVHGGRLVLEKGGGQVESAAFPVEARSLRVLPSGTGTVARVRLAGSSQVVVAAVRGSVRVTNAGGVLVANLAAGEALSFDPQGGAAGPTKIAGCLLRKDGAFVLVDQTTNVTFQVRGSELAREVGNRVEITGAADPASPSVSGASQVINVQSLARTAGGGCAAVARKIGAAGAAGAAGAGAAAGAGGAAAAAGITTAATVAIVGGVAAAATVGGLAAAGTFSGDESRPSTSR
jgi:hypothetical protein